MTNDASPPGAPDAGAGDRGAALVARMREGWRPFRDAVARVGPTGLDERTAAGWSVKAMVAHVAAWHQLAARRLEAFRATGALEPPGGEPAAAVLDELGLARRRRDELVRAWDMDAFNAAVADAAQRRPAHDVVADLDASFRRVREEVDALTDEQATRHLDDDGRGWAAAIVNGNTFGHYAEHQVELDAAVPRTAAGLVRRIEASWRPFRQAIREQGRAGLGEMTPAGWSYKDLVAHVIGWLQQAVKELREREFTNWDRAGIDAHNARSVDARRLVGPEALVDELDTSYRGLLSAVKALGDDDVADTRTFDVVAFQSYLHLEEHLRELGIDP